MALDAEFVNGIMSNTETSVEDKIAQIVAEHDADVRGLIQKRDELLGKNKDFKTQVDSLNATIGDKDKALADLEDKLNKSATDKESSKEYWQSQFNGELKKKDDAYAELSDKYSGLQSMYYTKLRNESVNDAVKDLTFVDGLKNGFTATVMMNNEFKPTEIDGEIVFLNKSNKTIKDVMHEFAMTPEGKAYLKNPSSGGSASTGSSNRMSNKDGELTREQYNSLVKDPVKFAEFRATHKGWKIVD